MASVNKCMKGMSKMNNITFTNNVFHLKTAQSSYIFKISEYGHLEHIHYGYTVKDEDVDALQLKKDIFYGDQVLYEDNTNYSLDLLPQEFPTYGRGDYNSSAIEVLVNESYTTDFIYDSYEIIDGDTKIKDLPNSYGATQTLIVHLKDKVANIDLDLYYGIFPLENIITRRCVLINHNDSCVLNRLMSYSLDILSEELQLMELRGAWNKETHPIYKDIEEGKYIISSSVGFSSSKANPAFLIKKKETTFDNGDTWGFNLIYSGNHYESIEKDEYGIYRIQAGINPERLSCILKKDEIFETPEAVLNYSSQGLNGLSANFHNFVNKRIVRSDWKLKQRPIKINSWEGFGFKFNKKSLVRLAKTAKQLDIELFVLDDGWFGRREDDTKGLGDYNHNESKLPGGIKALSDEIHSLGMMFGIWVEPEAISIDSALYEKHPEYALKEENRKDVFGRHELLMDLTNPQVRDYIVDNVTKLIDENKVDYIKWDMNRNLCGVSGLYTHNYIKGLYEVLDRIFTNRPHVLFESCSSGGNRFDLGMLCYSPQIWGSDNTDPIERIKIQKGLYYFYPQSTIGSHVSASPHSQTLRRTPLETRFAVASIGILGYELDLNMLSSVEKEEIKKQTTYYKKHRETFQYGQLYLFEDDDKLETFEVKKDETIITKIRKLYHAAPSYERLIVKGLDDDKNYTIEARDYQINIKQFGNLINYLLPIKVNSEGILVNGVSKRFAMNSAKQNYHASGSALRSGILLNSLFLGTGYNEKLRLPLDFGSDMYLIKEDLYESREEE